MKSKRKIRVIIADDHNIYRDGLELLLNSSPGIELVASAENGKQLIELVKANMPDVILTDLQMPVLDGIGAMRLIGDLKLPISIIAISTFDNDSLIAEAMEAGAMGYIVKNAQKGEIIKAIKKVYKGQSHYCNATSNKMIQIFARSRFDPHIIAQNNLYNQQEKEIVRMICQERSSKEIADILFINVRTVEGLRKKIMRKMQVRSVAGLAIYAIRNGLFNIEDLR